MRIRRALFALLLERAQQDQIQAYALAHMCGTSRTRASALLHGRIELFNSESLIDILARLGIVIDVHVTLRRSYPRMNFPNPRFPFASPDVEEGYTKHRVDGEQQHALEPGRLAVVRDGVDGERDACDRDKLERIREHEVHRCAK